MQSNTDPVQEITSLLKPTDSDASNKKMTIALLRKVQEMKLNNITLAEILDTVLESNQTKKTETKYDVGRLVDVILSNGTIESIERHLFNALMNENTHTRRLGSTSQTERSINMDVMVHLARRVTDSKLHQDMLDHLVTGEDVGENTIDASGISPDNKRRLLNAIIPKTKNHDLHYYIFTIITLLLYSEEALIKLVKASENKDLHQDIFKYAKNRELANVLIELVWASEDQNLHRDIFEYAKGRESGNILTALVRASEDQNLHRDICQYAKDKEATKLLQALLGGKWGEKFYQDILEYAKDENFTGVLVTLLYKSNDENKLLEDIFKYAKDKKNLDLLGHFLTRSTSLVKNSADPKIHQHAFELAMLDIQDGGQLCDGYQKSLMETFICSKDIEESLRQKVLQKYIMQYKDLQTWTKDEDVYINIASLLTALVKDSKDHEVHQYALDLSKSGINSIEYIASRMARNVVGALPIDEDDKLEVSKRSLVKALIGNGEVDLSLRLQTLKQHIVSSYNRGIRYYEHPKVEKHFINTIQEVVGAENFDKELTKKMLRSLRAVYGDQPITDNFKKLEANVGCYDMFEAFLLMCLKVMTLGAASRIAPVATTSTKEAKENYRSFLKATAVDKSAGVDNMER